MRKINTSHLTAKKLRSDSLDMIELRQKLTNQVLVNLLQREVKEKEKGFLSTVNSGKVQYLYWKKQPIGTIIADLQNMSYEFTPLKTK